MTPIQAQSLPSILEGKDVIAQGKTGSGKTAAFALGLLNKLNVKQFRVQTLVLCPTRELADQVAKEIRRLARAIHNIKVLTICGGMPFGPQIGSLEHGAHIIVGTPGRVEEHVRKETLRLDHLTTLVLDEADRMLDMGFQPSLDAIVEKIPAKRQTLLFSATYPDQNVAARGLDVEAVDAVINYQLARDSEVHIHRIGRTGRAGSKGIACSLYSEKEHHKITLLEDYLDQLIVAEQLPPIHLLEKTPLTSAMETLQIDGGKKQKVRAGDILGALTGKDGGENSIPGTAVGKINIADNWAYVAVSRDVYKMALQKLGQGKLKGRSFRVRLIRD
ncbi:UNVERIFIED_CONTAM: hypothetical protein GTU68_049636 [Idotea baltica]|nr:hypothetical protein [Idotea baltica]